MKTPQALLLTAIILGLSSAAPTNAQWSLLDNFESSSLGSVNGQGGWTTTVGSRAFYNVDLDPDNPGNQALLATGASAAGPSDGGVEGNAYILLGANAIADNTTGTVFFRMRTSDLSDLVFGASDEPAPTGWGSYEGYMVMGVTGGANEFKVRDAGGFSDQGPYTANEWYNVWLVLDHSADTTSLYVSQGGDAATLLGTGGFRTGNEPDGELVSLNVRMGASHENNNAQGYLDDIFVDTTGSNLSLPSGISMPALPGDVNLDQLVDINDYYLIRDNFRQMVDDPTLGDLTGPNGSRDGVVDFYDFGEWKANATPEALAIYAGLAPEPASVTLLALGIGGLVGRSRRA